MYDLFVIADETYIAEYKLAAVKYCKSDPVEFGKIGSTNYVYYVDSYYYSIGNYVDYFTNHLNNPGSHLNVMFHMRCKYER